VAQGAFRLTPAIPCDRSAILLLVTQPQFPQETPAYPEQSQATTALVLGILGLVACGILAPFAWSIGNNELSAIDAGRRPPENRGTATAGRILGIVGTVFLILLVVLIVAIIVLIAVGTIASWDEIFSELT